MLLVKEIIIMCIVMAWSIYSYIASRYTWGDPQKFASEIMLDLFLALLLYFALIITRVLFDFIVENKKIEIAQKTSRYKKKG